MATAGAPTNSSARRGRDAPGLRTASGARTSAAASVCEPCPSLAFGVVGNAAGMMTVPFVASPETWSPIAASRRTTASQSGGRRSGSRSIICITRASSARGASGARIVSRGGAQETSMTFAMTSGDAGPSNGTTPVSIS